jgi:hypothetical protein
MHLSADVAEDLRILVAPDAFKGSLPSVEAAEAFASDWARVRHTIASIGARFGRRDGPSQGGP